MPVYDRVASLAPPLAADGGGAERWLSAIATIPADPAARALALTVAAASPYLRQAIARDPEFAGRAFREEPAELIDEAIASALASANAADQGALMAALRRVKARAALVIALADIAGLWDVDQVTRALTRFADACLEGTAGFLLREAEGAGKARLADVANPTSGSGFAIIAMGKHGAFELNYSSDIDLIVLFDGEENLLVPGVEPSTFFVRLTRRLVALLQDVTEDGYVFRVDLRLRPDPRATQVAISVEAAAVYYENMGQNWERAAMIKARAAAGDIALGQSFLDRLKPYIWRKYLDFAAIADVQSLKRQIHAVKGHGAIAVHGHNIKLGRGGIREIEFFVQTQQLIAGGRNPKLRGSRTTDMLAALAEAEWITPAAAAELASAYRFLRRVEHRLQMVNDEQTHTLPGPGEAFERLARFCGHIQPAAFADELRRTFETVQGHYAALFEGAVELGNEAGSLVFTGGEDDPETIETLARMGYRGASEVSATIRGWHFGRYAATRAGKSKELLTELMPALLGALARNGDADQAFLAFDRFLAGLPAGVQLFSLLKANPDLLDLLATVLGSAPRLAEQLSRRPKVLDAVLDPGFFGAMPSRETLAQAVDAAMPENLALDEAIDRARVVGKEQAFRIGVRVLAETVSATDAGRAFSDLADLLIGRLHRAVVAEMVERHGDFRGGRSAVVALGKLGGREMTAGSDLDLIVVYDADPAAEMSDGPKPLGLSHYYSRLTQRLIAAVAAPTAEGVLYEVDMRLRPSGSKGPVATSLSAFTAYHRDSAWTWEKLALTRARPVAGDPELCRAFAKATREALAKARDAEAARADVAAMRALMLKEHGGGGPWDIKRVRGGLVEVEFIAQTLEIVHAKENPEVLDTNTLASLARIGEAGFLRREDSAFLRGACDLYHRLTQVLRLCAEGEFRPDGAPAGLKRLVAGAAACPDIAAVEALLAETEAGVVEAFDRLVGRPA